MSMPPPPPTPPCRRVSGYFGVLLNKEEIDKYKEKSLRWRKEMDNYKKNLPPPPKPPKGIREVKDGLEKDDFPLSLRSDWPRKAREETFQDEILKWKLKEQSFHWYEFGIGLAVSSLFWGIMFKLFGGS
ncbi:putative TMhelix containing protein [Vibrio phage 495E54-1]|nr:putative TMhelix containing protein [Vibrio phage 495E54-1]